MTDNSNSTETTTCPLEETTFDYRDDTVVETVEEDISKYTTIDHLDEDAPIYNQRFVLLSFISPEGIMNCKVRGLKVRGIYATEEEAKTACDKLKKKDKYFDVFVGEVGKWLPWDPSMKHVEKVKYGNKKLEKIMDNLHKKETQTLNELVGRHKDMLDKESKSHKNRIRNSIKDSVENYNENTNETEQNGGEEELKPKIARKTHDSSAVKQRLQKTLENRKKNNESAKQSGEERNKLVNELDEKKKKLKEETDRYVEKSGNVNELKKKSQELDNKLKKMKEQFEQRKKASEISKSASTQPEENIKD